MHVSLGLNLNSGMSSKTKYIEGSSRSSMREQMLATSFSQASILLFAS